ncbi:putative integral membrane protein conserved region-domain-containing protein [Trichophaea hybrida]|nr:putative integral membrane protein conserved region-domain-containing protein [Trichophaea hybrida]
MPDITTLLLVYILGGFTFIPATICLFFVYAYFVFPEILRDPPEPPLERDGDDDVFKTEDDNLVRRLANSVDVAAGYFLVTREFVPGGVNGKPPERASPAGSSTPTPQSGSPSVYQSMYRTLFDRKSSIGVSDNGNGQKGRGKRAMNEFFVVLRHGHLMLYDDEQQTEVRHVVSLAQYSVSIYGGGEEIPEGELYIRRNAICLRRRPSSIDPSLDENSALPFFMFSENCFNKEDFYLALVKHQEKTSEDPTIPPRPLKYRQKDVISLVQRLHSSEDHLLMNWVNGLTGRIFLSIYRTPAVEQFIRSKITKKISRVAKPNFLSDIKLQHIHVGDSVPYITNPRLKEMTAEGDFCCEFDISYGGNFRLEIATKATMNLGARFKAREVNLLLAVLLKRLDGHGVIRIKPPPSNRLWFSFERMPKMELVIEPIVGSRQVAWGPILRIIESRIREVIEESVVLPYYDDIPFTDTIDQKFRGGIWHTHKKTSPSAAPNAAAVAAEVAGDPVDIEDTGAMAEMEADETLLSISGPKSQSTPELSTSPTPAAGEDKAASVVGLVDTDDLTAPATRTASVKSKDSSSTPSIGTDAINVTAIREKTDLVDAASSAMNSIKSRSSSSPQSSSPISNGNLGPKKSFSVKSIPEGLTTATDVGDADDIFSHSMGSSISGGSAQAFGSNFSQPNLLSPGSRSSTVSTTSTIPKGPLESIAAIGTATAAVKKWYATRKNNNTPNDSNTPAPTLPPRHLPPSTIPPPPSKKSTAPIAVPKRKQLPPPLLPARKNRNVSAPPLPPREDTNNSELLVVAAPDSEPNTPGMEDGGFDAPGGLNFDSESSSSRGGGSSWERGPIKKRAQEESGLWHPTEETEMRTRG